jgi:hypothetical protein
MLNVDGAHRMHILWHEQQQQQHDKTRAVVVRKARVTHRSRPVCEAEQIHAKRRGRDQSHVGHVLRKAVCPSVKSDNKWLA